MPTVLAVFGQHTVKTEQIGACEIYRVTMPLQQLGDSDKNWHTGWTAVAAIPKNALIAEILRSDIIVLPRWWVDPKHLEEAQGFFETLKSLGKKIVYECDDDYSNLHRVVHSGGDSSIQLAKMADAITVSTPHLGKMMQELTGKKAYVAPNCTDPTLWDRYSAMPRPHKLTIGLAGTKTHYYDWIVLKDVLPKILEDYPDVQVMLAHFHPEYFTDMTERVILNPGSPYVGYPGIVNQFDILLAPVNPEDQFNLSKSDIKAIEGMSSKRRVGDKWGGACVLATDMPIYRRSVANNSNGLLVKYTAEDWDKAIRRVIEDEQLRKKLQINGYKWVKRRYIQQNWKTWREIYTKIIGETL